MLSTVSRWFDGLRSSWISPQEVRAEVWALGGRHRGKVLEGARLELATTGLAPRRAVLLRAVIRAQRQAGGDPGASW